MTIPIDEMLAELRSALEAFENEPSGDNLDNVYNECMRITESCEDIYVGAEE